MMNPEACHSGKWEGEGWDNTAGLSLIFQVGGESKKSSWGTK